MFLRSHCWRPLCRQLKDIRGSFQIIGFLHNIDYVNNPNLFPTELIARPYETFDLNKPDQKSCWVEFEERNQDKKGMGVFEITTRGFKLRCRNMLIRRPKKTIPILREFLRKQGKGTGVYPWWRELV